jgi:hypothetical protein
MSDIADKIYAATGLTLNAEAAAKVGHMIRLARQEAADEIEKLRAALRAIAEDCEADYPPSHGAIKYAARAALGEKQ